MSKQIFIAEDDLLVLEIYERVFGVNGYTVVAAHDGEEAITILSKPETDPVLILLDIMMPKVSGFEVLKFIKASERLRSLPVMFVTNLSAPEHIQKGLDLGADKYLLKSEYDPQQIVNIVSDLLAGNKN